VSSPPASLAPIEISQSTNPGICERPKETSRLRADKLSSSANVQNKILKSEAGTRLTGVVRHLQLSTPAVVVAEDWPTWLTCLPAMGFRDITVWSEKPELVTTYFADLDVCIYEDITKLLNISKFRRPMLFVSGSCSFVRRWLTLFEGFKTWVTIPSRGAGGQWKRINQMTQLKWQRLRHSQVGGITDGTFWVGSNTEEKLEGTLDPNFRCLKDVLSPVVGGAACPNPPPKFVQRLEGEPSLQLHHGILGHSSLIPWGSVEDQVYSLDVFSKTAWSVRQPTSEEYATAHDLPVRLQKFTWDKCVPLPFVSSTPSKILMAFREAIVCDTKESFTRLEPHVLRREDSFLPSNQRNGGQDNIKEGTVKSGPTITASRVAVKASKADDAEVDTWLWDVDMLADFPQLESLSRDDMKKVCEALRHGLVQGWKKRMRKEALEYLRENYGRDWYLKRNEDAELKRDASVIADAMSRIYKCTWWDWCGGSTLFYWRWHSEFKKETRDGIPIYFTGKPPRYRKSQPKPSSKEKADQVRSKLARVRLRGYIEKGTVLSLTGYFDVQKTLFDIRMVYDATRCGLNDVVWAPNFYIPLVDAMLNVLDANSWMGDIDLGEMFLNFPLDVKIRPLVGVDLSPYFGTGDKPVWERWSRCLMGFKPSPYNACRTFMWGEELIRGNPADKTLPFQYERIELNLPGDPFYDPTRPWVSKRRDDGQIASDILSYVDDLRSSGASEELCKQATKRIASVVNYLGMQDAPRKRRIPSKNPGAWAGSLVSTDETGVHSSISEERWAKTKSIFKALEEELEKEEPEFTHKQLLSDRGFLIYVARTYPTMVPYLKGLHLTIEHWRDNRDV
jgi:hypothetical protein